MRYLALACDYDGTIAADGRVDRATLDALQRVKDSGRRLLLVTGRELDDLLGVFPEAGMFDRIVAENGALVYNPATRKERLIGEPPPPGFLRALERRGVSCTAGRVIVASEEPHKLSIIETIREMELELQVVFNRGSVMVLPSGVNKAVGLQAALDEIGLSPHNVAGVGDAENDHAFLSAVEAAVAVANALPALRERADLVTEGSCGQGVVELAELLLESDLGEIEPRLGRHRLRVGETGAGEQVDLPPHGAAVLLAGPSESGKSTLAATFLERLVEARRQFCIVDPEGDYTAFDGVASLGTPERPPAPAEALEFLARPNQSISLNLIGLASDERPPFFESLLPRLLDLRATTGRPHWLILDEAHHVVPRSRHSEALPPHGLENTLLVTMRPETIATEILMGVGYLVGVGENAAEALLAFYQATRAPAPALSRLDLPRGEAVLLRAGDPGTEPVTFRVDVPRSERRRHRRKYAEGQLAAESSFYFRGPSGRLNLRASNLSLFLHLAEGVDEETWLHHLRQGDYSRWFRENIKDETLAQAAEEIEKSDTVTAEESRERIKRAIEERYTLPLDSGGD